MFRHLQHRLRQKCQLIEEKMKKKAFLTNDGRIYLITGSASPQSLRVELAHISGYKGSDFSNDCRHGIEDPPDSGWAGSLGSKKTKVVSRSELSKGQVETVHDLAAWIASALNGILTNGVTYGESSNVLLNLLIDSRKDEANDTLQYQSENQASGEPVSP